jgi:hypothetical protein
MSIKTNQKKIVLIIILLTLGAISEGKKIGTFPDDYFKMPILRLDDSIICVMDRGFLKGHIYDRKTLKKIAEFGGKGQGPSEFSGISGAVIDDNYIYVTSSPKLCIFSKQGKFIKEFRVPFKTYRFMPLGNENYVATYYVPSHPREKIIKNQYQLFDENLKLKKTFFTSEYHSFFQVVNGREIVYMFRDCEEAVVYKDIVYIGDSYKGIYFAVFDQNGEKLYDITRDEKKRILTREEKEMVQKYFKTSPPWRGQHPNRKIVIRDVIPAFQAFFVNDDRIYVFTYPKNRGWYDIFILDLKGNLLKKKKMSIFEIGNIGTTHCFISKGKLYFVKDSEGLFDSGTEFHEIDIWGE